MKIWGEKLEVGSKQMSVNLLNGFKIFDLRRMAEETGEGIKTSHRHQTKQWDEATEEKAFGSLFTFLFQGYFRHFINVVMTVENLKDNDKFRFQSNVLF